MNHVHEINHAIISFYSCVDAVSIVANISKHTKYIASTVAYICDQVTKNPNILQAQVI